MPMDLIANKAGQGHTAEALADARRVMAIWRDQLAVTKGPFLFAPSRSRMRCSRRSHAVHDLRRRSRCDVRAYVDAVQASRRSCRKRDAAAEPATRP